MEDYRLHACLRVLLIREWVDLSHLEYGVTNGVVYLTGTLRHHLTVAGPNENSSANSNGASAHHRPGNGRPSTDTDAVALAAMLEAQVQELPGVRDVVFRLSNLTKEGSTWVPREA